MAAPPDAPALGRAMARHLKRLGLANVHEYFAWCRDHGFEPTSVKSPYDRQDEIDAHERDRERRRADRQVHRNPRKFLEQACAGKIRADEITRPGWREVGGSIAATKNEKSHRDSLCNFLVLIERKADFLFESVRYGSRLLLYADGLIRLHDRKGQWLRPPEDWQPRTHNPARQFSSLCRHLLANYPVPAFMDSAWMRRDEGSYRYRDWFIHIGFGRNIRTARTFVPMTKRQAHHFLEAPDSYSIEEALLWAEIHALGGDRRLVEAVLGSRLGDTIERDDERRHFWASVYRFFVANPLLDRRHVGPIVDFLDFQRFREQEVVVGPGQVERRPPPQPNLSMSRRSPETLLRQVERWHGNLRHASANTLYWKSSGIPGLVKAAGARDAQGARSEWHIRELLTGAELIEEGRQMHHCVATYAQSCARGHCSIWTMERHDPDGRVDKHLTLEVEKDGLLVEARGRQNRYPSAAEMMIVKEWCASAQLRIGRFMLG